MEILPSARGRPFDRSVYSLELQDMSSGSTDRLDDRIQRPECRS